MEDMALAGTMLKTAVINVDRSRLHKVHLNQRPRALPQYELARASP